MNYDWIPTPNKRLNLLRYLPLRQSPWLWVGDGYWRMFVRWLYARTLDELYIPSGTRAYSEVLDVPAHFKKGRIVISATSPKRRGQQDAYFFEQYDYIKS